MPNEEKFVVFITGASSGIGASLSKAYAKNHANKNSSLVIIATARRVDALEKLKEEIEQSYPSVSVDATRLDVTDYDQVFEVINAKVAEHGHIDVVIANSGKGEDKRLPFGIEGFESDESLMKTNYIGFVATANAAMAHFRKTGKGHFVGISSVAAYVPRGTYYSSKTAVTTFMDSMRNEFPLFSKIYVTSIHPGYIDTEILDTKNNKYSFLISSEEGAEQMLRQITLKRSRACIPFFPWSAMPYLPYVLPNIQNKFNPALLNSGADTWVVYITGASSGLGKGLAMAYAEKYTLAGKNIVLGLMARRVPELEKVKEEIEKVCFANAGSVRVEIAQLDVTRYKQVFEVFKTLEAATGPANVVIANAGVASHGYVDGYERFQDQRREIETNVLGAIATIHAGLEVFKRNGGGQLVTMSSVMSFVGAPGSSAYSSTKSCLTSYTNYVRDRCKNKNVTVTSLHPGFIKSDLGHFLRHKPFEVSLEYGSKLMLDRIEKRGSIALVPFFPWFILARLMHFLPSWLLRLASPFIQKFMFKY